ncbi:hypothetical protein VZT92_015654 [Zoarces viviparus]|uniref:Secreted protein n=1 Tax=Zoarces viviparus TaxID=48416 RepID=A0AAW1EXI8_ZOAVI
MKVWGSSLLFCLCRLFLGNKCSTVRRLGSVSAGVMIWLLGGASQSRYHFSSQHPTALTSQTDGPMAALYQFNQPRSPTINQ